MDINDTIAAIATPPGEGGIAVIRVSGPDAVGIVDKAWIGKRLKTANSHTVHLGEYTSVEGKCLDQAVATIFLGPKSYTGEDTVELSIHGSRYIQKEVLNDLTKRGARPAGPGEFTQRAFLNGRIDLTQAEGVADLIAAASKAAHDIAMSQTKGVFSKDLEWFRNQLLELASLLELELDFSEEDVQFANRQRLLDISRAVHTEAVKLARSYQEGKFIKEGVPSVIAGIPNSGKSSLLNLLVDEDKAIVSNIPGTTRDLIEATTEIGGILFRFTDTAGLRHSTDPIEKIGIERAKKALDNARITIWMLDPTVPIASQIDDIESHLNSNHDSKIILLFGKSDLSPEERQTLKYDKKTQKANRQLLEIMTLHDRVIAIDFSSRTRQGLEELKTKLFSIATGDKGIESEVIITNARHQAALLSISQAMQRVIDGISDSTPTDFIAQDLREALHHLGTITGAIPSTDILSSIFSRFCIGK